jgi:hypothetical protein
MNQQPTDTGSFSLIARIASLPAAGESGKCW